MAGDAHPPAPSGGGGKPPPPSPGKIFGYGLALIGVGIGVGFLLWAIMYGFAVGIDEVGQVKRHYPEVILGFIFLCLLISFMVAGRKKEGGGH